MVDPTCGYRRTRVRVARDSNQVRPIRTERRFRTFSTHYMALYAPVGLAFMVVYVLFGRVLVNYLLPTAHRPSILLTNPEVLARSTAPYHPGMDSVIVDLTGREPLVNGVSLGPVEWTNEQDGPNRLPGTTRRELSARLRHIVAVDRREKLALGREFKGILTVAPTGDTPYGVLNDIVAAAYRTGFGDIRFAVMRSSLR